jgi:outer membrane protein OmpA-like peptidoglycan-associated protein
MKKTISLIISLFVISACNTTKQPTVVTEEPPKVSRSKSCDDYQVDVGENLNRISSLRGKLKKLDCPTDKIETDMSNIAAAKAQKFLKSKNLAAAKNILTYKYAPKNSWLTQAVRGEMAAKVKDWKKAALFYNQSLDLIAGLKKNKPPKSKIERVYRLASEVQLLAGMNTALRDDGAASGTMRDGDELGIVIKAYPIPVQFELNQTKLTSQGKQSAKKLVQYLNKKRPTKITVIGHTDPKGTENYNCQLSRGRAMALKDYLVNAGIQSGIIETIGKGEKEPFDIYDASVYSQDEIDQIHRRVEFSVDDDVLRNNAC